MAFFLSFVVWFDFAPFSATIGRQLDLSPDQLATLALCNIALTVPARVFIGMVLDRVGPRRVYGGLLLFAAVPNTVFALSSSFSLLVISRLALSIVGAGFVVGIRMVAEWFPPEEVGTAEGIYGGWGNFGAGAASLALPLLAGGLGATAGWRWAIGAAGLLAAAYGLYYLRAVRDTPPGRAYARPHRNGALEVTSPSAVYALVALTVPLTAAVGLIAWRVARVEVLSPHALWLTLALLAVLMVVQVGRVLAVNRPALAGAYPPEERYSFAWVVVLCLAYLVTFGSEPAVVSMLPTFFADTWDLGPALAGLTAGTFAVLNLVTRPAGGIVSDVVGNRGRPVIVLLAGASTGAYGNLGGVVFLTVLSFVTPQVFFLVIGATAALVTVVSWPVLADPGPNLPGAPS